MNASSLNSHEPQPVAGNTERVKISNSAVAPPVIGPPAQGAVDWDEVHQLVQRVLDGLAAGVCEQHQEIRAMAGQTRARAIHLFSFRTFDIPTDHAIEAVTAGVDFRKGPGDDKVTVRGDIVREESGDILFETPSQLVSNTHEPMLTVANEVANALSQQAEAILAGLDQPCCPETEGQ
jgi:hypothetical protein